MHYYLTLQKHSEFREILRWLIDCSVFILANSRSIYQGNGTNVGSMSSFMSVDPHTAKRSYVARDYYEPNASRPNLLVLLHSQVTKVRPKCRIYVQSQLLTLKIFPQIIFVGKNHGLQTATAVEFISQGVQQVVKGIKRDVILSAGR